MLDGRKWMLINMVSHNWGNYGSDQDHLREHEDSSRKTTQILEQSIWKLNLKSKTKCLLR